MDWTQCFSCVVWYSLTILHKPNIDHLEINDTYLSYSLDNDVLYFIRLEKIRLSINGGSSKFDDLWGLFFQYVRRIQFRNSVYVGYLTCFGYCGTAGSNVYIFYCLKYVSVFCCCCFFLFYRALFLVMFSTSLINLLLTSFLSTKILIVTNHLLLCF